MIKRCSRFLIKGYPSEKEDVLPSRQKRTQKVIKSYYLFYNSVSLSQSSRITSFIIVYIFRYQVVQQHLIKVYLLKQKGVLPFTIKVYLFLIIKTYQFVYQSVWYNLSKIRVVILLSSRITCLYQSVSLSLSSRITYFTKEYLFHDKAVSPKITKSISFSIKSYRLFLLKRNSFKIKV